MHCPYRVAHDVPLFLAPRSGVSESPFRLLCRRFGADVVVSEFISAVGVARGIEHIFEDMRFQLAERPIGIQLYGADATIMARAAEMVTQVCQPDFIDINFGCPVKKVVKNNGGSGCLKDLGLVQGIIRAVCGATHLPVTVKIRSGWDEAQRDPVGIALRCRQAGARGRALHPPTRTPLVSGQAERADPTPDERFATALEHARLALELQGDARKTALEFRKHFGWYTKGVPGAAALRERLFQIDSMQQAAAIFSAYLEATAVERAA